jgi:flagellar protein FlaJ
MPLRRYLATVLLPTSIGSLLLAFVLGRLFPSVFSGVFGLIPPGIPLMFIGLAVLYPLLLARQRGHQIDHNMHYFITHLGTLATTRVPPVDLFEMIGEKETEYGPLAEECEKVAMLVKDWNMGMAAACRFTAKRTPSQLFGDFLERFAFGVESGTDMSSFLGGEQEVVMADYERLYQETLQSIDNLNSLYNGVMMSIVFLVMFALMAIILMDISAVTIIVGITGVTAVVQCLFLFLARMQTPEDPIWASNTEHSPLWPKIKHSLPPALLGVAVVGFLVFSFTTWPAEIQIALTVTPLAVPGWIAGRTEMTVKRRDDNYPGFMRSLGSSTAARGGDERAVLNRLRQHDFGPLSTNIRDLFARLQLRVDDDQAWSYFTSEAGSRLIERFTQMYDEAVEEGGEPDEIGRIISENMIEIVGFRKLRYQAAGTFRGVVFGVAVGTAFALFVGLGVVNMLVSLFSDITKELDAGDTPVSVPTFLHVSGLNIGLLRMLSLGMLFINAALSSVLLRIVDGGTHARDLQDFPMLLWASNLTALGSWKLISSFGGDAGVIE